MRLISIFCLGDRQGKTGLAFRNTVFACFESGQVVNQNIHFIYLLVLYLSMHQSYAFLVQLKLEGVNVDEEETISEVELLAEVI